jgi:hypothetical protein
MKTNLVSCALLALIAFPLSACGSTQPGSPSGTEQQPSSTGFAGLFPTGVDDSGNALAPGAVDPHYTLTSTDPSFAGPDAFAVKPAGPLWVPPPSASSMWDSIQSDGEGAAGPVYTYTTTFTLNGADLTQATLSGEIACDDECVVLLNGTEVASLAVPAWEATHAFTVPAGSPFQSGTNTLSFAVQNRGGVTGLGVFSLTGDVPAQGAKPESLPPPSCAKGTEPCYCGTTFCSCVVSQSECLFECKDRCQ